MDIYIIILFILFKTVTFRKQKTFENIRIIFSFPRRSHYCVSAKSKCLFWPGNKSFQIGQNTENLYFNLESSFDFLLRVELELKKKPQQLCVFLYAVEHKNKIFWCVRGKCVSNAHKLPL